MTLLDECSICLDMEVEGDTHALVDGDVIRACYTCLEGLETCPKCEELVTFTEPSTYCTPCDSKENNA